MFFSTKIYIPVQKYLFQYRKMCIPVQIIFPFRYRTINSSTEIYIRVRKYKFQYRNISSSTEIYSRPRVEAQYFSRLLKFYDPMRVFGNGCLRSV